MYEISQINQNNINYKNNRRTRTAKQVIPPRIVTCTGTIVYIWTGVYRFT